MLSALFDFNKDGELELLCPEELSKFLGKEPFRFDWVMSDIENVFKQVNKERFDGKEAVLWQLGYRLSESDHRSPLTARSPSAGSSESNFLNRHKPVVLRSVPKSPPARNYRYPASPRRPFVGSPNADRKRNPDIFDANGRVQKRRKWTDEQTTAIIAGLRKHATFGTKWSLVLNEFPEIFKDRTSVMIKDRYRTLKRQGRIPEDLVAIVDGEVEVDE